MPEFKFWGKNFCKLTYRRTFGTLLLFDVMSAMFLYDIKLLKMYFKMQILLIPSFIAVVWLQERMCVNYPSGLVNKCKQSLSNVKSESWNKNQLRSTDLIHAFIALICQYLQMTSTDSHTMLTSVWCHVSCPSWGLRSRWGMHGLMLGDMHQRGWVPICLSGLIENREMWE